MTELQQLIKSVSTTNETSNDVIRHEIRKLLKNIELGSNSSRPSVTQSMDNFVIKTLVCKRAMLYIRDKIKCDGGNNEEMITMKDLDVTPLTDIFAFVTSNPSSVLKEADEVVSELLVEAAKTMKMLSEGEQCQRYKKKLFCKAQRLFDPVC